MRRSGVVLAGLALVAAVWLSLVLSQRMPVPEAERPPEAAPQRGDVQGLRTEAWYLPDDELLGFVEVPIGAFLMGSDATVDADAYDIERWAADEAQGTVEVPTFLIGRFEVTVAQYGAFIDATGYRVSDDEALRGPPDHPVVAVSWTDALAYTRWLEATLGAWSDTPPRLAQLLRDGWRIAIPSEAEWEKAARGADGRIYPWGNEPRRDRANFGASGTMPVGSFECPECPFGLSDMAGNVWEWTRSPYQPYPYDSADRPEDLEAEALWVMRGGAFGDTARNVRAANRGGADPGARRPFLGFRLVISRF